MAAEPTENMISIASLHLDSENPRHDLISNEPEIIAALYQRGVAKLASHIAKNGLSPLERLAVMRHDKLKSHYVALEGNRRVCALKLLRDPGKAPHPAGKRLFEQLKAESVALPEMIKAVIFSDRESANKWLAVKHEGPQEGIGTVEWGTGDKARFNLRSGSKPNPNRQALELRSYALTQGLITEEESSKIGLTTLTRYLSNKLMREALGLVNSTDSTIGVASGEFDIVLQRFLRDAIPSNESDATPPLVHSRSKVAEREQYARQLRAEGVAPVTWLDKPVAIVDTPVAPDAPPESAASVVKPSASIRRSPRDRDLRPYVIPSDFKLTHSDPVLGRLIKELRRLKPEDYPFSCNYLSRAVLERATILYANRNQVRVGKDLHVVLLACIEKMIASGVANKNQLKALSIAAQKENDATSIQSLGAGVHGGIIPLAGDLKKGWESKQFGLELLINGSL